MLVVVAGGAGFVGTALCGALRDEGYSVISVDDYSTGSRHDHLHGVDYREGDAAQINSIVAETPDLVFHFAEFARMVRSSANPEAVLRNNFAATLGVLELWRRSQCKLVYAGSSTKFAPSGQLLTPYSWVKYVNAQSIVNFGDWYGLRYAIAYLSNVYGPGERHASANGTLIETFIQNRVAGIPLPVRAPGSQTRHFTHILDTSTALLAIGHSAFGDGYVIASQEKYSVLDVALMVGGDIEFLPPISGNRLEVDLDPAKTLAIGWKPTRSLRDYILKRLQEARGTST